MSGDVRRGEEGGQEGRGVKKPLAPLSKANLRYPFLTGFIPSTLLSSSMEGSEIREKVTREIDVDKIQSGIVKKVTRIPELRLLFPFYLKTPWNKAIMKFSSLKGKSYKDIHSFRKKIWRWGNISAQDVRVIAGLELLNSEIKSPELELYLIYLLFIND